MPDLQQLRRQYPRWSIWRGRATGAYWALPPRDHPTAHALVSAADLDELARRLAAAEGAGWPGELGAPVSPVQDLNRLVTSFTERVPAVAHAAVVSADGLPLAASAGLPRDQADQLAAVTSGLTKLVQGAARIFSGGPVAQAVVVMEQGTLIMMSMRRQFGARRAGCARVRHGQCRVRDEPAGRAGRSVPGPRNTACVVAFLPA